MAIMFAVVYSASPDAVTAAFIIAIASLLIAIVALSPLAWIAKSRKHLSRSDVTQSNSTQSNASFDQSLIAPFMFGIALRLFGTVALFLLCRYQLGQPPETIAALVAGWYVWLTAVEVFSLAQINSEMRQTVANSSGSKCTIDSSCSGEVAAAVNQDSSTHTPLTE